VTAKGSRGRELRRRQQLKNPVGIETAENCGPWKKRSGGNRFHESTQRRESRPRGQLKHPPVCNFQGPTGGKYRPGRKAGERSSFTTEQAGLKLKKGRKNHCLDGCPKNKGAVQHHTRSQDNKGFKVKRKKKGTNTLAHRKKNRNGG